MEVISGKIVQWNEDGSVVIHAVLPSLDTALLREYGEVVIGLADGRSISPDQRRKAYALMGEIAAWSGSTKGEIKLTMKQQYIDQHMEALQKTLFSLSNCDVTTAKEFIGYLIEFMLTFDVPAHVPLRDLCDDVERYVYACMMHKKCAVCGKKAELHHIDRVGMGRNRHDMCHIGMEAISLCREHHDVAHTSTDKAILEAWHLVPIEIDQKIAQKYRLGKAGQRKERSK